MTTCPKCNRELSDGTQFCDSCGTKISETREASKGIKKLPKKAIMFGCIAVAVIAILILVIFLFSGSGQAKYDYALYIKDQEIFFSDLKKDSESWSLTSRLIDTEDMDDGELVYAGSVLGLYTYVSEDGKYIFFPDKINGDDEGFNLYYREIAKPESEAIKIDSGIRAYTVNSSATIVTYLKGEEGNLYQYTLAEDSKDKVASEVEVFEVSDDGTKLVYINSEGGLYLKYAGKDKEKIAGEVSSLEYLSDDFKTVYYIKESSLYKQVEGKDRVKIASDVYDVINIYETGEIYYLISESEGVSLMDYVIDDMKISDAYITEPTYPEYPDAPDYPYWSDYDTDDEYYAACEQYEIDYEAWEEECDRMYAEYEEAYYAYWAKEDRDELREELEGETLDYSNYALCYYNGTKETVITDAFIKDYYYSYYTYASDAAVIIYEAYNQSNFEKVKLSEVDSIYDIKSMVEAAMYSSSERYIAVKNTATVIEQEKEAQNFSINSSGTVVYYIDDIPDGKDYGELYRITIADGVVGKAKVYDSDVFTGYCHFACDDKFEYYKDFKDGKGELYINKVKIDYDVSVYNITVYSDENKVIYFTDWDDEKEYGTLKIYHDGESVKIADDVHIFSILSNGRILYLYDYSLKHYNGELYVWDNGKTRKIDDDVVCIIPFYETKYRGYTYN